MAILAALACLGVTGPAHAARHTLPGHRPPARGPGRIIPVLADGTLREPSVDRAQAVDEPDSLPAHRLQWEVTLAGGSIDRIGALDSQALLAGHVSLTYGLGSGADLSVRIESWDRTRIDLADSSGVEQASGTGPTTIALGRTVRPKSWSGAGLRYGVFARLAGVAGNPGAQQSEFGGLIALAHPLGESAQIAVSAMPAWVGNAADDGHHLETTAGVVVSREIGDHASLWLETVSVTSGEPLRPWLGVVDAGLRLDLFSRVGITLAGSAGRGAGRTDLGALASIGVHS